LAKTKGGKMKKNIIPLITITAFVITNSCNSPTENQQQFKHPKDMVWTADTLMPDPDAIQLLPENLLVFALNDIWLVCYSDVARRLLWHYDGKTWTPVESGGGKRYTDLAGYNQHDIWLGGYSGEKAHFTHKDGNNFIRYDFEIKGQILDMTMDDKGNIWACGRNGIIMKYDKKKWIVDTVKISGFNQNDLFLYGMGYYNGKIHILSRNDQNTQFAYLSGDIKNWTTHEIFRLTSDAKIIKWGTLGMFPIINSKFYSYGLSGIWQLNNSGWFQIYYFNYAIRDIYGPAENYILGVGAFRNVLFYDGNSWQNIGNIIKVGDPYFAFNNVWTDGYEIIIAGYETINGVQKTIIFHGK
jgi:hypothetical protein